MIKEYPRPNLSTKHSNKMEKDNNKRKWIILEDYPSKAEYLIGYILMSHPDDEIHWIFPDATTFVKPTYLRTRRGKGQLKPFSMPLHKEGGKVQKINGEVFFHRCQNIEIFSETFDKIAINGDNILLLDVELKGLGGVQMDLLAEKGKKLLYGGREEGSIKKNRAIITIMSRVVNFTAVKEKINIHDDRVLALGGRWQFIYSSLAEDCRDVVKESHKKWQKLYEKPKFTLDAFLDKMSKLSQHECHNWQDEMPEKLEYYIQNNRWDEEWGMPIQLGYLIKLLDYDPKEFIDEFGLKKANGHYNDGCPICHALKLMGTDDKDTHSFSLLGITFICWAAYRRLFKEEKGNELFIEAIKSSCEKIARRKFISPPQALPTLQETIRVLYKMMQGLYYSTNEGEGNPDNLKEVELDESGLSISLRIDPSLLQASIAEEYKKKLKGIRSIGGGVSAQKIVNYFIQSNYCDRPLMGKKSFLGGVYGLKVFAAGDKVDNGTVLKFGNEI